MIPPLELEYTVFCARIEKAVPPPSGSVILSPDLVNLLRIPDLGPVGGYRFVVNEQVIRWCKENILHSLPRLHIFETEDRSPYWATKIFVLTFEDDNEAVLFKMFWG